ncbi:sensor histidine kinase [Cupriavidus sp. D384]|uniref:sensor histidine kinase n=1 Tax=Cupriavidus sp. D384 TaxID=1538095 RepID=UPI0008316A91|nr:ATP-binding protein [Cupriavidus sp. D384]
MIVHDVVQPVASAATRGQSALRWLRQDPPDLHAAVASLERLVADAQRAGIMLADLKALASPTARPRQPVLLAKILRDTLHWLDDDLQQQGINVVPRLPGDDIVVVADRTALHQLLVNLIVNAMESMTDTPRQSRQMIIDLSADAHDAIVAVSDCGCGFSTDAEPHLFDAFYTTKAEGMGMGLAICHRIVTDYGGTILAERRAEGGACFQVRLPREPQAASGATAR